MSMYAPVAPRPPSASTAMGVAGGPPPRRRRSRRFVVPIVLVLLVAALGGAGYALRDSIDGLLEDLGIAEPDIATDGRVAVSTDLHGGLRWTMAEQPIEEERTNPVPDGTMVTVSMWAANPSGLIEVVGIFERRPAFDLDQAMTGTGMLFGGQTTHVETHEVQGREARTGTIAGIAAMGDGSGTGRVTMVLGDEGVVLVMTAGDDLRAQDVNALHRASVDSLRFP